jgi:RNA polymerase sigma-70 factor (ECF subfamily)
MIARRRLIDRIRFMNRRISADSIEDIPTEPFTRLDENIQVVIEAKEVAAVMKDLRPEQRQVLYLSIVQGLSHQEISDATGMPLGTVKTHARRGILQAREALGLGNMQDTKEVSV